MVVSVSLSSWHGSRVLDVLDSFFFAARNMIGIVLSALLATEDAASQPTAQLTVSVVGFRHNTGHLLVALSDKQASFLSKTELPLGNQRVIIINRAASVTFIGIAAGDYAVSVTHDENDNLKVDTNFIGMPKEGVGVSNEAKGFMGPPKFKDAKFHYDGGKASITITLVYL